MNFLKKMIFERFLDPLWVILDGKKTLAGGLATVVFLLLLLMGGPEAGGVAESVQGLLDLIVAKTGEDAWLTTAEGVLLVGILHKIIKWGKNG